MKVIGAGFGRTGTLSLQYALTTLGLSPCYHMTELMNRPEQVGYWQAAAAGKALAWRELFDHYQAGVDFPVSLVYRELLETYPQAKVILTVRDPEKWYESTLSTIYQSSYPPLAKKLAVMARLPFSKRLRQLLPISIFIEKFIWQQAFGGRFKDKAYALDVYHRHIEKVKRDVPANQLLVFEVREGWQPLCRFLDLPIPSVPFPHVNSKEDFPDLTRKILRGDVVQPSLA
jgi:hypothetical protein